MKKFLVGNLGFILSLIVAGGMFAAVAQFIDLGDAVEHLKGYSWEAVWFPLSLSFGYYLLKSFRWHYFLNVIGIRLPLRRSLLVYMGGQWAALAPGGELVRAYMLTKYNFSFARASAASAVALFLDFLSLAIVGSISLLYYPRLAPIVVPFTLALVAAMSLFIHRPFMRWFAHLSLLGRTPFASPQWRNFYRYSRRLLAGRPLVAGLSFGIPIVILGATVLFQISQELEIAEDLAQSLYIYSLSQLAGSLSPMPNGLGTLETTSILLFAQAGLDTVHAASAMVVFRLCTLVWGLVLGAISMILLQTPLAGPRIQADPNPGA